MFGGLPFAGTFICFLTEKLSALICALVSVFSRFKLSVISLEYPFAGIIICAATLIIIILFIVKLKRRLLTVVAPFCAVAAFCVCLGVYSLFNTSVKTAYLNDGERDALVIGDRQGCIVIDVSDGSYSSFYNSYALARKMSYTEIEAVALTHYHARHVSSLDKILSTAMVRQLLLPLPNDTDESEIMRNILLSAADNGVRVTVYRNTETAYIRVFNKICLKTGSVKTAL